MEPTSERNKTSKIYDDHLPHPRPRGPPPNHLIQLQTLHPLLRPPLRHLPPEPRRMRRRDGPPDPHGGRVMWRISRQLPLPQRLTTNEIYYTSASSTARQLAQASWEGTPKPPKASHGLVKPCSQVEGHISGKKTRQRRNAWKRSRERD